MAQYCCPVCGGRRYFLDTCRGPRCNNCASPMVLYGDGTPAIPPNPAPTDEEQDTPNAQ